MQILKWQSTAFSVITVSKPTAGTKDLLLKLMECFVLVCLKLSSLRSVPDCGKVGPLVNFFSYLCCIRSLT